MSRLSEKDLQLRDNIKKRMNELLEESKLAQSSFADKANIDRQHINRWVNPHSNRGVSIYNLNKFCNILDITLKDFFDSPLFGEDKVKNQSNNNTQLKQGREFNHLRIINIDEFLSSYSNNTNYYKSPFSILAELENKIKYTDNPDSSIICPYSPNGDIMFELVNIKEDIITLILPALG